jgi:hypothetical protein
LKPLFLTTFRYLNIRGNTGAAFELLPGVNLTNDVKTLKSLLSESLREHIGYIEFDHLQQSDHLVYGHLDDENLAERETPPLLLAFLLFVKNLFRTAWMLRDHCFACDSAFMIVERRPGLWEYSSNFLAQRPFLANGTTAAIEFTLEQLTNWRNLHDKVETNLFKIGTTDLRLFLEKGYARSGRALQFLESARSSPNLAFRIAHSCSALEALFSTDSAELSHKLSERVAFFLGELGHSRIEVFRNIKAAYGIRSKLTHGDTLNKKAVDELPHVAAICDQYLRAIFGALFGDSWLVRHIDVAPDLIDRSFESLLLEGRNAFVGINTH